MKTSITDRRVAEAAGNEAWVVRQRRAARRTAWIVAGIALLVYAGFIASGVFGQ